MIKGLTLAVGTGLTILWIAGLSSPISSIWLTWGDGIAGLLAFSIAGNMATDNTHETKGGSSFMLSGGLFVMWVVAYSTGIVSWQIWGTFTFASTEMIIALMGGAMRTRTTANYPPEPRVRRRHQAVQRRKVS